jgi:hypothetical protein
MSNKNLTQRPESMAAKKKAGDESYTLHVFSSFEDENEATAAMNAVRSPEENFIMALELIRNMYKAELEDLESADNKITFKLIDGLPVE